MVALACSSLNSADSSTQNRPLHPSCESMKPSYQRTWFQISVAGSYPIGQPEFIRSTMYVETAHPSDQRPQSSCQQERLQELHTDCTATSWRQPVPAFPDSGKLAQTVGCKLCRDICSAWSSRLDVGGSGGPLLKRIAPTVAPAVPAPRGLGKCLVAISLRRHAPSPTAAARSQTTSTRTFADHLDPHRIRILA